MSSDDPTDVLPPARVDDPVDAQIIRQVSRDGRATLADISKSVGLSVSAVQARLRQQVLLAAERIEVECRLTVESSQGQPGFVDVLATRAPTWLLQFPSLVNADQRETLQRDTLGATCERMVREICETLEAFTTNRTLILVLEDLHWADLSTLDVISSCARRQGPSRLLLLGTLRPAAGTSPSALSRLHQDLAIHDLCREINVEPFHPSDVSEYVSLAFGPVRFADELAGLIHRHSGGNPLFVTALVRDLLANGIVVREGATWRLTAPVERIEPSVPATLQDMLNVQFDQLLDQEQRILRRASAIGERFAAWAVADGPGEIDAVERVCETLAERRLFIRGAGMGELADGTMSGFYQFHHALYRQAVYRRLSEVVRSKVHRSIGERLETLFGPPTLALAAELSLHFEKAHEYERAIKYLTLAAKNLERRFALRDAVDVLFQAVGLVFVPRIGGLVLEKDGLARGGDRLAALNRLQASGHRR